MIDYGTRQTDLAVRRTEWRLSRVYRQAQRDIDEKLKDWQKRHEEREKRYRQQLADGKITQADFDAWMRGQVFQDKQWQARKAEIDRILLNADREAQRIVNEGKISVFADNANYIGYDLERNGNVNTGFTLYDENTVGRLIKSDPQILPKPAPGVQKDKAYTYYNKLMNSAITQGIVQGETIPQIAKRIVNTTGERSYSSAVRNARTAYTGAQNAGRMEGLHQAQRLGIKVKKQWMATLDDRTRDTHADLDGQIRDVDEPFKVDDMEIDYPGDPTADPSLVYNCFVGETNVATDSDIIRSYKHDYSGELITVETAGGVHFTCTPNHPILTSVGWVPAALLNNGYNLLVANVGNEFSLHRNGNIKHIHTRMKALFNALHYVGLMDRDATLRVDFHGDIPTTDVEVITKKWKLRGNRDSGCTDGVDKLLFKDSNEPLVSKSAFVQHFGSVGFAALRFIGSFGETLAFFRRRLSHAVIHGFRAIAGSDTAIFKAQAYNVAGDMQLIRESLDGFTGKVFVDNIVNIKITTVSHVPVYNLQTGTGHYFVSYIIPQNNAKCNGNYAIAKNCRCTLTYVYPDYPSEMQRRDNETGEIVGDMTYREWEALKQEEAEQQRTPTFEEWYDATKNTIMVPTAEEWADIQEKAKFAADAQSRRDMGETLDYFGVGNPIISKRDITDFYQYAQQTNGITTVRDNDGNVIDHLTKQAEQAMDGLLDKLTDRMNVVDAQADEDFRDIKRWLRETPLYISQQDRANIPDFEDYRKSKQNFVRVSNDPSAISLDSIYQDLVQSYPGRFNPEITDVSDMMQEINNGLEALGRSRSTPIKDTISAADYAEMRDMMRTYLLAGFEAAKQR